MTFSLKVGGHQSYTDGMLLLLVLVVTMLDAARRVSKWLQVVAVDTLRAARRSLLAVAQTPLP